MSVEDTLLNVKNISLPTLTTYFMRIIRNECVYATLILAVYWTSLTTISVLLASSIAIPYRILSDGEKVLDHLKYITHALLHTVKIFCVKNYYELLRTAVHLLLITAGDKE